MKRKKKNTLMFLCICLASITSYAQNNNLKLGIGYQRTWMLDKQASPLKYQTSEKTFSLGYEHIFSKSKIDVQLNGALGKFFPTGFFNRYWYNPGYNNDGTPKKDSSLLVGDFYNARFKLGYGKEVSSGYTKFGKQDLHSKNYVGASLNDQIFYTDNIVRTGWLNTASLNGEYEHVGVYNTKHSFVVKLSIPLFARNSRLPYHNSISSAEGDSEAKAFFKQGSRFAWIGNFQNVQLDAGYQYMLNRKVGIGLHYFGQWLHYNYEKPINLFQNNLSLTASLNY